MRASSAETIQKNSESKGVIALVAEIRSRLDSGHYNFMTWNGRTRLWLKLNEYESYAKGQRKTGPVGAMSIQKQKLKGMETELRTLLKSTY